MDPSVLEQSIKALENTLDSYGGSLSFWTTAVVIGLIIEYAPEVWDLIKTRPFKWKLLFTIVGGVLITGGVAGELYYQTKSSRVEGQLRNLNHQALAPLVKDTAEAQLKTKELEGQISDANARAKTAEGKIASAEAQIADARKVAATATATAEKERLDRLKLEAQLNPRRLDGDKMIVLSKDFAPLKGKLVRIASYSMDIESEVIAIQIKGSLDTAGAVVINDINAEVSSGYIEVGIIVAGSDLGLRRSVGDSLGDIIRQDVEERPVNDIPYGPSHYTRPSNPSGSPVVTIFVGRKSLTGN